METKQRLVDANELLKKAYYEDEEFVVDVDDIKAAPTIDAVEVVRCKDCKFSVQDAPYDAMECVMWRAKFGITYTEPDGYCHKGERRTDVLPVW